MLFQSPFLKQGGRGSAFLRIWAFILGFMAVLTSIDAINQTRVDPCGLEWGCALLAVLKLNNDC